MADSDLLHQAGDINIEHIEIFSAYTNAKIDIKGQVLSIQIFEDIYSPFTTGTLVIKDALDLINALPFVGEEYISIKMNTPTFDIVLKEAGIISGKFYVYKMTERESLTDKGLIYMLHFISIEAVKDINTKISRGFEGKVSDIVSRLITDKLFLNTKKRINIEPTSNSIKYVSNYWSIIKNLIFLTSRSNNPRGSPTYLFFENRNGFNYVSLDLLNRGEVHMVFNNGTAKQIISPDGGSRKNIVADYGKLLDFNVPVGYDYIDRVTEGAYASRLIIHDMTSKLYKTSNYTYLPQFLNQKTSLNKFPIATPSIAAGPYSTIFVNEIANSVFSGYGDVSLIMNKQERTSRLKQSDSFRVNIRVNGSTSYTAGQVVYLDIFSSKPTEGRDTKEDVVDNMYSGKYLIGAINHSIDRQKHECTMELIKDSLTFNILTGKT